MGRRAFFQSPDQHVLPTGQIRNIEAGHALSLGPIGHGSSAHVGELPSGINRIGRYGECGAGWVGVNAQAVQRRWF